MPNHVPFAAPTLERRKNALDPRSYPSNNNDGTWYQVAEISWFDLSDHWFFTDRIIIVAYAINRVVACFSESCVLINTSVRLRARARTDCSISIGENPGPGNITR